MTVTSTKYYTDWYVANGVTQDWDYDFTILSKSDIVVQVRTGLDNNAVVEYTTDLEMYADESLGFGHVRYPVLGAPVPTGKYVRILRRVNYLQTEQIGKEGRFFPKTHESAFDKAAIQAQQLSVENGRSIKVAIGESEIAFSAGIPDGATLMKNGNAIVGGPSGLEILAALTYANAAYNSAAAAAVSASQAAASAAAAAVFNPVNYYLKTEVDTGFYSKTAVDAALAAKASLNGAETLTNKTLTSPTLNTPSLVLKQSASPTPTTEGDLQWDTDDDRIVVGDGSSQKIFNANDWVKVGRYSPSAVASLVIPNLGAFKFLRLSGAFNCSVSTTMNFRVSADNGSTWIQGATDYSHLYTGQSNSVASANAQNFSYGLLSSTAFLVGSPRTCAMEFMQWNVAAQKPSLGRCLGLDSGGRNAHYMHGTRLNDGAAVALNALQLFVSSGTFTADFYLEGMK